MDNIDVTTISKPAQAGPWLVCTDMTAIKRMKAEVKRYETV